MYDSNEFNYEELEFLRQNTKLGPISLLKIQNIKNQSEKYRKWYLKNERELLESDYSMADELEYELRTKAWENSLSRIWKNNPDGQDLSEFAKMVMEQKMQETNRRGR